MDLADRRTFIGGSDAPSIPGGSPWKSKVKLWLEKTGAIEPDDLSEREYVHWGTVLEDPIAQEYSRRTGRKVRRVNDRRISMDFGFPKVAQIDRLIECRGILEIKTTESRNEGEWGEDGSDEIPDAYKAQVQHQLVVMNRSGRSPTCSSAGTPRLLRARCRILC